jgi:hypothetical protein
VALQVSVSPLAGPQEVALYEPAPLPPMITSLAVGALLLPDHERTAVIVTGEVEP